MSSREYPEDTDTFASVVWSEQDTAVNPSLREGNAEQGNRAEAAASSSPLPPSISRLASHSMSKTKALDSNWAGKLSLNVTEPVRELEGSKESFVSYAIVGETDIAAFVNKKFATRRRFQDFVFLKEHLTKDFPACVVPPLPGKHRLEYVTGDRFSTEFVDKRRIDLNRFLKRISRHPTLARSSLLQAFLESVEWNVVMHQHLAHPPSEEAPASLLDNLSDTLLNAFSKLRKPDERFVEIKEELDKFEEALAGVDRTEGRTRARTNDLSNDYDNLAGAIQGLAFLESGMADALTRFESSLAAFSVTLKSSASTTIDPFLDHLSALLAYSHAFRGVLRLRDQKQLDFEELSAYLTNCSVERDRLAAGLPASPGIGSYFKSKVEALRGADSESSRESRIARLDVKIKELQDAVTTAHETCDAFNNQVLKEHTVFQTAKKQEMKQLLLAFADGQIALYRRAMEGFEQCVPSLERIKS